MERIAKFYKQFGRYAIKVHDPDRESDKEVFWERVDGGLLLFGDVVDRIAEYEDRLFGAAAAVPGLLTRENILDTAKKCVCGDREQDYGSPENNFGTIADLWAVYLQGCGVRIDFLEPHDVAVMLGLLKIARIASGHGKADNWVDLAGYAACGGELEGADG